MVLSFMANGSAVRAMAARIQIFKRCWRFRRS